MKYRQMTDEQREFCIGVVGNYLRAGKPHKAREMAKWCKTAFLKKYGLCAEITANTIIGVIVNVLRTRGWIVQQCRNGQGFQCTSRPNDTPLIGDLIWNLREQKRRTSTTIENHIVTVTKTVTQIIIPENTSSVLAAERIKAQLQEGDDLLGEAVSHVKAATTQKYRLVLA